MTTNTITIQDFVSREIIYCVSSLIYTLNQEGKLDEEYWNLLESIDWDEAETAIEENNCIVQEEVDFWGVYDLDTEEDFYGLTVWGRTTTGMAIAYDCVIKEIYEELISS